GAERRTVGGLRLRDVLLRALFPRDLDPAQAAGQTRPRGLRVAAPAGLPGPADPGDRLHLRRLAGDTARAHRHVHLFAGDPVGLGVHRHDIPIPADLGVVIGDVRDDPGGNP